MLGEPDLDGKFEIGDALTLDRLETEAAQGGIIGLHPRAILPEMPSVCADSAAMAKIRHGNAVNLSEFSNAKLVKVFQGSSELIAIASRIAGSLFQPKIVLI